MSLRLIESSHACETHKELLAVSGHGRNDCVIGSLAALEHVRVTLLESKAGASVLEEEEGFSQGE